MYEAKLNMFLNHSSKIYQIFFIWQVRITVSVELSLLTDLIASYRRPQIWAAKVPSARFILNPRKIKVGAK